MAFNGGPDNCPAEPSLQLFELRTAQGYFNGGPDNCPAEPSPLMAIIRAQTLMFQLQWRAGQLPGRTSHLIAAVQGYEYGGRELQWRAGQLPGRTTCTAGTSLRRRIQRTSMEGRTIARPNPSGVRTPMGNRRRRMPSMEGRTIARPNQGELDGYHSR